MLEFTQSNNGQARLRVVGVGGGGGNALNNMISQGVNGIEFIAANTDGSALERNLAQRKIQLGTGLGAGGKPDVGRAAAEETEAEIQELLRGADMVFVTAGMGGGTGTGAAPVVAKISRDMEILTVGVVTRPFEFEGQYRMRIAMEGIEELKESVHSLIIIPNQRLLNVAGKNTSVLEAFRMADDVLLSAVRGISDLISGYGIVNVDFADVKSVMNSRGMALMGTGQASGEARAVEAARQAISNPLLDDVRIEGARGVLVNVTGGSDVGLHEIIEAINMVTEEAHEDAQVIFGQCIDESMGDEIRLTVIATGFEAFQGDVRFGQRGPRAASQTWGARRRAADLKTHRLQSSEERLEVDRRLGARTVADKSSSEYEISNADRTRGAKPFPEDSEDEYDIPAFQRRNFD